MKTEKDKYTQRQVLRLRHSAVFLFCIIVVVVLPYSVCANAPSGLTVSYNLETQELSVTITHQVSDPTTHYIYKVEIQKNGADYNTSLYTSQPDPNSFTYIYNVNATTGDVITVKASCIQGGSKSIQYTVSSTNNGKSSTPGFEMIALIGALLISIILLRRR
jgi:hypothetical protein